MSEVEKLRNALEIIKIGGLTHKNQKELTLYLLVLHFNILFILNK